MNSNDLSDIYEYYTRLDMEQYTQYLEYFEQYEAMEEDEAESSEKQTRRYIARDREMAEDKLRCDYFGDENTPPVVSCMVATEDGAKASVVVCLGYSLKGTKGAIRDAPLLQLEVPIMFVQPNMPAYNGYPFPDPPHSLVYLPNTDGRHYMPVRFYLCSLGKIDDPVKYVELRRHSDPLLYPLMWYVHNNQVGIVNKIDLDAYRSYNGLPKLLPNEFNFRFSPHDELYPYMSPYWHLNPQCYQTREESLDDALQRLIATKNEIISNYLEYWLTYKTCYSKKEGEEVCAICLKDFKLREQLTELNCRHYYHGSCIKEWLTWKNQCPLCRRPGYILRKWRSYVEALVGHCSLSDDYRLWAPQKNFGIVLIEEYFSAIYRGELVG
ncbi:zinc finger, RING/FYVE/PHD-type containing protein [Tanacetum coccineum]